MNLKNRLTLGLPDGAHIRKSTSDLLNLAEIHVDVLILELTLTGKSARDNKLKILEKVGDKIFTCIYMGGNLNSKKQHDAATEFITSLESTVKKHNDIYVFENKNAKTENNI